MGRNKEEVKMYVDDKYGDAEDGVVALVVTPEELQYVLQAVEELRWNRVDDFREWETEATPEQKEWIDKLVTLDNQSDEYRT